MSVVATPTRRWWRGVRERVPINLEFFEQLSKEPIPHHMKHWWYCLGGTPLILLAVQAVTGVLLTFYYSSSPDNAWESVRHITEDVPYGWWIRSVHRWAANLMVVAVCLHLLRVFFTGAYRKPRELNWIAGVGLLFVTLGFGFTGYALVYDQVSYWAAVVGTNVAGQFPLIGPWIAGLLRGGADVSATTLSRFFVFHVGAMPTLMLLLVGLHIFFVRIHGVMELDAPAEVRERPITVEEDREAKRRFDPNRFFAFFPDHTTTEIGIAMVLLTLLSVLALVFPPPLGVPADPGETPGHIKPEWYFFPLFRWLKLVPLWLGMAGIAVAGAALLFWPFIDAVWRRYRPRSEAATWVGAAGIFVALVFLVWEAAS